MKTFSRLTRINLPGDESSVDPFKQVLLEIKIKLEEEFSLSFILDFSVIEMHSSFQQLNFELYIFFKVTDDIICHEFYSGLVEDFYYETKKVSEDIHNIINVLSLPEEDIVELEKHYCIVDNTITGMLFHEGVGHYLEKYTSDSLNGVTISKDITLIDYADSQEWKLPNPCIKDHDGNLCQDTVLLNNRCVVNSINEKRGNGHLFMSKNNELQTRMRNTILLPGKLEKEELFKNCEEGYFLFMPDSGFFDSIDTFKIRVKMAVHIKNGIPVGHVRNVVIVNKVDEFLNSITEIANDLRIDGCFCVKSNSALYVGIGGPSITCSLNLVKS